MPSLSTTTRARRRGIAAIELLLITPVFLLVLAGMIGFADLIIAEQKMDQASGRVARIASMGGSEDQMREALVAVLGPERAKHAKIKIRVIKPQHTDAHAGDQHDGPDEHGQHAERLGNDDEPGDNDNDNTHAPRAACGHLELIEVCVELDVSRATVTKLVPVCRTETIIGRTVVQRQ